MTWLYVLAALAVLGTGWAVWLLRAGGKMEKLKDAESELDAIDKSKSVAEGINRLPDGESLTRLRERYSRVLPPH